MNNNRHMDLETFAACVLQTLQQKLPHIDIQLVHKAAENDATIPLLTFTSKNEHHTIYPSIPMSAFGISHIGNHSKQHRQYCLPDLRVLCGIPLLSPLR